MRDLIDRRALYEKRNDAEARALLKNWSWKKTTWQRDTFGAGGARRP